MKNIINISEFNEIVTGIKAMKADLVCIYGNMLIGVDNTMSTLKTYTMPAHINLSPFTIITKELSSKFFANIIDTNIVIDTDECKIYCPNHKNYADESNPMINPNISEKILYIYERLCSDIKGNVTESDITDDANFQEFKNMKIAQGAKPYYPYDNKSYGMYLYSGAIPMNKNDRVFLSLFDKGNTFIAQFRVSKKKLGNVYAYFRFAKLY